MTFAVSCALLVLAIPIGLASAYLCVLALLSRRAPAPTYGPPLSRFDVIVPAHDEERCIVRTIRSLQALDYPEALRHIHVIADNCVDRTAALARNAGVDVLERLEPDRRGKGYALAWAFEKSLAEGWADALVVVDADSQVSANLLRAFQARFEAGASAVQAEYGVLNREDGWRPRLMAIAFATFHRLRSSARERLGLSIGLRGNGMAFRTALVRELPPAAFSIVEDLEYGLRLGEAGHRVHHAAEAEVRGEVAVSERGSRSQRRRWEGGRWAMARAHAGRLLWRGVAERRPVLVDLALDLLVPPLTFLVALAGLETLLASLAVSRHLAAAVLQVPVIAADVCLALYVARGWALSGAGVSGLRALACAPLYVAWRLALWLRHPAERPGEWIRTAREGRAP